MTITNEDNMQLMARYEDNHFDLAIVDPPYGININSSGRLGKYGGKGKNWDNETPKDEYFKENVSFASCEYAYTNFDKSAKTFYLRPQNADNVRIHPTQKPVKLYEWLLMNYAKEGDKILDTHLGSGSIAIACHNLGFNLTACELDKDYYEAAIKRINNHKAQLRII